MLDVKGLSKSFGEVSVLKDLDLEVEHGEFLVLLGPSGSGKSTLARIIAGLEKPNTGSINFDQHSILDLEPKDRNIAMVFQNYALYPHKTVFDNIAFPLEIAGLAKAMLKDKVELVAKELELDQLLQRKPKELSGGQRQRVALARALIKEPKIFLLDEPLSNLDAKLRMQMRSLLAKLHKQLGKIFIYVTHDQIEALTLATKVAVLHEGKLQQLASPKEIYTNPANTFVASFIGSPPCNILDLHDQEHLLGIRPEYICLKKNSSDDLELEAEIVSFEFIGNEYVIMLCYQKSQTLSVRHSNSNEIENLHNKYLQDLDQKLDLLKIIIYMPRNLLYYFNRRDGENIRK